MAELTKPQYHSKSTYPSSRSTVYNVAPAQEQYRGPDEGAGQVDLSSAKIFDEIQNGLELFGEIYTQSEKTADVLQAKSLLMDKMKDTQRINELLATELPNTGYEHLKLKNVLDKYKARDLEGKTDLYLGSELQHNISSLQMPTDISENVKSLIEDDWLKMDVGIINDIIGQVDTVQSAQTLDVMSLYENEYKREVLDAYMTAKNPSEGDIKAEQLRAKLNKETKELSFLGTWTPSETQIQMRKNGQLMLDAKFKSQYYDTGVREGEPPLDPREKRTQALSHALNGRYRYKDKDGTVITLNPSYFEHLLFTDKERLFNNEVTKTKASEKNAQELTLIDFTRKLYNQRLTDDKPFNFIDTWKKVATAPGLSNIAPSRKYEIVWAEEIARRKRDEDKKLKTEGEVKTEQQRIKREEDAAELDNLKDVALTVSRNFVKHPQYALERYTIIDKKTGARVAKSEAELIKLTGNSMFRQHYITGHLLDLDVRAKQKNELRLKLRKSETKSFQNEIDKARSSKFLKLMSLQASSDLQGASHVVHTFMKQEMFEGKERWVVNQESLGNSDSKAAKLLQQHKIGYNDNDPLRSHEDIAIIQEAMILPYLEKALDRFKHFTEKMKKEDWTWPDVWARFDHIANSYYTNVKARMEFGPEAKQDKIRPIKDGREPSDEVTVFLSAFEDYMEHVASIGEGTDDYTLKELDNYMNHLSEASDIPHVKFATQQKNLVSIMMPYMQRRFKALHVDTQETGFKESGQAQFIKDTGKYNIQKYYEWQEKFGVVDKSNLISKEILTGLGNVSDHKSYGQATVYLDSLEAELDKYGDNNDPIRLKAFHQMLMALPEPYREAFEAIKDGHPIDSTFVKDAYLWGRGS